jgi:epoxyqueuosine reductase QueG
MEKFKKWISEEIKRFVQEDDGNQLDQLDNSTIFDEPLVGFAAGDDKIFGKLKEVIGSFHLTPHEVMAEVSKHKDLECPEESDLGVISYVLPISDQTRRENAKSKDKPSQRWAHTRLFGEIFNSKIQNHLVSFLEQNGYRAVAPEQNEALFRVIVDDRVGFASPWSQRHIAFSAGLGSFGLSDGLITAVGKAHRLGSVVVNRRLDSPIRPVDIHQNCLKYSGLPCMTCQKRCPVDAITEDGHDKQRCAEFVFKQIPIIKEQYGIDIYGCGLCQTGVPCQKGIPKSAAGF